MRPADVCNLHVKEEHPIFRVASGFVSTLIDLTRGRCFYAATARFDRHFAAHANVLFSRELAAKRRPLMLPSPFEPNRHVACSTRTAKAASSTDRRNGRWWRTTQSTFHRQRSPPQALFRFPGQRFLPKAGSQRHFV